jgi:hypothetical protein
VVQLQLDEALALLKAMGRHAIAQGRKLAALESEVAEMRKSIGVTNPMPGVGFSMRQRMPAGDGAQPSGGVLSKSVVSAALQSAFISGQIDADQYRRAAGTLDSRGVDAALAGLPATVTEGIRKFGS